MQSMITRTILLHGSATSDVAKQIRDDGRQTLIFFYSSTALPALVVFWFAVRFIIRDLKQGYRRPWWRDTMKYDE